MFLLLYILLISFRQAPSAGDGDILSALLLREAAGADMFVLYAPFHLPQGEWRRAADASSQRAFFAESAICYRLVCR